MFHLVRTEMSKQLRRPRTWVALAVVILIPIIITVALKLSPPDGGGHRGEEEDALFTLATQSGLLVPAAALRVMSEFFLVVILCMFAGDAIASEAGWGNLRFLLTRPITRTRLLTAKLAVAGFYGLLATSLIVVAGLIAGVLAFGFHPVVVPILGITESTSALLGNLAISVVLAAWGIAGIAAFAFMLSTMMDNSAGAIFGAVGLYIVTSILGAITSIGPMRFGFPTYYGGAWAELFRGASFGGDMLRNVLVQIPYVLVFVGIGYWWFNRKDITS